MRLVLALTLLALLPPAVAARPDLPDPRGDEVTVGPCVARWGSMWPGESLGARCMDEDGRTVLAFSHGTCALGHYVYANVAGRPFYLPCDASLA